MLMWSGVPGHFSCVNFRKDFTGINLCAEVYDRESNEKNVREGTEDRKTERSLPPNYFCLKHMIVN